MSPDTQWRTVLRSSNYKRAYWASAPGSAASFATGGSAKVRQTATDNLVIQSDLNTRFKTFGMTHELVTGVEYLKEEARRWNLANIGNSGVYFKDVVGF
jgi:catecholate siderophore receptor